MMKKFILCACVAVNLMFGVQAEVISINPVVQREETKRNVRMVSFGRLILDYDNGKVLMLDANESDLLKEKNMITMRNKQLGDELISVEDFLISNIQNSDNLECVDCSIMASHKIAISKDGVSIINTLLNSPTTIINTKLLEMKAIFNEAGTFLIQFLDKPALKIVTNDKDPILMVIAQLDFATGRINGELQLVGNAEVAIYDYDKYF